MKKVLLLLLILILNCNMAFADVVGPVVPGVTYMHGVGQYFDIVTLVIAIFFVFLFLCILMSIITIIMKKCNADIKKIKTVRIVFLTIFLVILVANLVLDWYCLN